MFQSGWIVFEFSYIDFEKILDQIFGLEMFGPLKHCIWPLFSKNVCKKLDLNKLRLDWYEEFNFEKKHRQQFQKKTPSAIFQDIFAYFALKGQ